MSKWQPIETAPKHGTILLYCSRRGVVCGYWDDDSFAAHPRPYWTNDKEPLFGVCETRNDQPTHWQLLPEPPEK